MKKQNKKNTKIKKPQKQKKIKHDPLRLLERTSPPDTFSQSIRNNPQFWPLSCSLCDLPVVWQNSEVRIPTKKYSASSTTTTFFFDRSAPVLRILRGKQQSERFKEKVCGGQEERKSNKYKITTKRHDVDLTKVMSSKTK